MTCEVVKCRDEEEYHYLGVWICEKHWIQKCNGRKLKLPRGKVI